MILTEFYRLDDYEDFITKIQDWKYEIFITPIQKKRNDIFIAVPDFLAVSLESGEKDVAIIGVRFFGNYSDMYSQFINFYRI